MNEQRRAKKRERRVEHDQRFDTKKKTKKIVNYIFIERNNEDGRWFCGTLFSCVVFFVVDFP